MEDVAVCTCAASAGDGAWLAKVPAKNRVQTNPFAGDDTAAAAGALLFEQDCASCHGDNAGGHGRRPSLRTERVQKPTDGELQWLLRNGSLRNGMPSWSGLPEVQRSQLVHYLHTLKPEDGE
jgi:mono/diheme cytochrome c family protein